ncbi:hypothetical protein MLD38_015159 [Melastoma candidum]|uniref:Uncharacterized protein n=1 Tax=Melastoma candidum TaxID=119954 RepID=A0ACB9RJD7_9MYRT|nr:hypothetical protein MLD38_015159 [Melastoma candidum]
MGGGGGDDRSKAMPILLDSIAKFLGSNGFSRTLKKFRSETHLQKDSGTNRVVDLEEICLKFMASGNVTVASDSVKQDTETKSKHKKKKANHSEILNENDNNAGAKESHLDESGILVKEKDNAGKRSKDRKKRDNNASDVKVKEWKEEGKKRIDNLDDRGGLENKDDKNTDKAVVSEEIKAAKKRKWHTSEDNATKCVNGDTINESIPKCVDVSKDFQSEKKKLKTSTNSEKNDGLDAAARNGHNIHDQEAALALGNDVDKNTDKEGEKSASKKSAKKQHNGSVEPTSAEAFQRVKVEEVTFADDRLKDNSYWAKGGAETGYGAKAQEVLGQVKGRDFRHEKTKKKRGSYRGGQIDLQSHSIKLNYSDDE